MAAPSMVRSAMDVHRRNSKVSVSRRNSGYGSLITGNLSSGQPTDGNIVSVNVDSYLYGGSDIMPRKKKTASDDEDEDEPNIGLSVTHDSTRSRNLSPIVSEDGSRQSSVDGVIERNSQRKPLAPFNEDESVHTPAAPVQERTLNDENLHHNDHPWYLQVLRCILRYSIDPDGLLYFYWKTILTLTVMYNYVIIILRIAFDEMRNEPSFASLDILCDFIYMIDFIVEAKSCYLSNGSLITDPNLTLQNYMRKKTIVLDVIAVLPMRILIITTAGLCNIFRFPIGFYQKHYSIIEPTFRLNKLAKTHVMNSYFNKTESRTNSPNLLRAVRLGIQLALVIHWMACLYYMISMYEGLGSSEWTYPSDPEYRDFQRKYIVCMYWSIMTLTTIGERPSPVTSLEYIFTGLTFLIGVFVFAAVVGNVGDVISNMNAARRDFQNRMDQIKFYLNHRQVPDVLQTRIKRWAEYTWDRTKAVDEPSVLQWLPERLRTEVAIYVHLSVLKKVSIFDDCEEGLLRELVLKLKPQIYSPGDYICRIGEIGREMYIINHGQVEILFPDVDTGAMRQVAVMNPGNFFGEISLLKLDDGQNKRTADVRSIGFSELLCLSRRDLMVALTEYPEAKRILEEHARERFHQTRRHTGSVGESSGNSSRESVTSTPNSPMSAKQLFATVMKKEGFGNLLKRKDTDLMAIKSAVEDLRQSSSTGVHNAFVSLHKEIRDLNREVMQKELEMQEAKAEIDYLKSVISQQSSSHSLEHGAVDDFNESQSRDEISNNHVSPHKNGINVANIIPRSPSSDQRFRTQFYSNHEESTTPNALDNDGEFRNNFYKLSFFVNSQDFNDLNSESKDSDKNVGAVNSSFQSDDESSDEDLDSIEEKFDNIGKNGVYVCAKRSVSMNVLSELSNQQKHKSEVEYEPVRKASFQISKPPNLSTPKHLTTSVSDNVVDKIICNDDDHLRRNYSS